MTRSIQETAFQFAPVRLLVGLFFLARGAWYHLSGNEYRSVGDLCFVARVATVWPITGYARRLVMAAVRRYQSSRNTLVEAYHADPASAACANLFTINGGKHDLLRDLIVLKAATPEEKGVVLLKYVRTFDAVNALFDLPRLMQHYVFVLEPCWAGYWDPSLLMFIVPGQPVFVQCFTQDDLAFVRAIGAPLVPIQMGPADWVDADLFRPPDDPVKTHDVVMVANWAPHKRHVELFRALRRVERRIKVLLIGFPWGGRTADDIRREAGEAGDGRADLEILERVPASEVSRRVSACKAFVFLSKKEGDNKALVEAMFANVPVVVYDRTIGGATSRVNPQTGVLSSDADLARSLTFVLDHPQAFSPRAWALEHTGSTIATRDLNALIKAVVESQGGRFELPIVEKTNSPNLAYKNPGDRDRFALDYERVLTCRRS